MRHYRRPTQHHTTPLRTIRAARGPREEEKKIRTTYGDQRAEAGCPHVHGEYESVILIQRNEAQDQRDGADQAQRPQHHLDHIPPPLALGLHPDRVLPLLREVPLRFLGPFFGFHG